MSARPLRKSLANAAAASGLALATMFASAAIAPSTAAADTGDRTQTVGCASLWVNDSAGATHARLQSCTVTWGKNIFDGSYWQTVKFQLLDARTDGVCAKSNVILSPSGSSAQASECNGVWTTKTASFNGRATNIFIRIAYGSSSSYGNVSTNVTPPSGF
ncbi:hypothetical protein ACFYXS_32590 [Streptomyces sp. NPDC002574]|uniref:hypothetical protein n=1 Tax=Streptomyces sp. NPDC002574 TaxID=3364652 RepID=UPI0036C6FB1B